MDELQIETNLAILCEGKHSEKSLLPSKSDIKDGLLKLILFSNLLTVSIDEVVYETRSILSLTSSKLKGRILSNDTLTLIEAFFSNNRFSIQQKAFLTLLFEEANINNFIIKISGVE